MKHCIDLLYAVNYESKYDYFKYNICNICNVSVNNINTVFKVTYIKGIVNVIAHCLLVKCIYYNTWNRRSNASRAIVKDYL